MIFAAAELQLPDGALGEGLIRFKVCQGDTDGDGDTDQDDLDFMLFAYGAAVEVQCPVVGDLDGVGKTVNQDDLEIVLFEFGTCGQG